MGIVTARAVGVDDCFAQRTLHVALAILMQGWHDAQARRAPAAEFAVPAPSLLEAGCTENTLRYLLLERLVTHHTRAQPDRSGRRRGGALRALSRGVFFLTEEGAAAARGIRAAPPASVPPTPSWKRNSGELHYAGQRLWVCRRRTSQQRIMLDAFQCRNWAECIDDPLPADQDINSTARLQDAVKYLNRVLEAPLICFFSATAPRKVGWRPRN
jgi:hypothetical protein